MKSLKGKIGYILIFALVGSFFSSVFKIMIEASPSKLPIQFIIGGIFGYSMGLIPYQISKKKGLKNLAKTSAISCTIAGSLVGAILTLPILILFILIALIKTPRPERGPARGLESRPEEEASELVDD